MNDSEHGDPRIAAIPDVHGHAKGEHKSFAEERPIPLSARMLFLWFFHACRRGSPRFLMVSDHMNYLTFEDPAAVNLVRRALKLAQAGDLYGAAETAGVDVAHAAVVSEGLRRGMRYSIGAEVDNDPRARPDAQNIVDAMKPDGMIRSVHFLTIDHPTHGAGWNWPFDNPEFASLFDHVGTEKTWELYMATLIDAIERLPGNIVGHFYVPAIFGHWPDAATLDKYEDQLLDACLARDMAIEFNTRFLYRDHTDEEKDRYLAANARLLRKAKDKGVGIAVGSDAHSPKDQGHAFDIVLSVLDTLDINEIVFPIGGRLLRVALRVVKEPDPPAPEPVPVPEPVKPVRKARTSESPKERPVAETPTKQESTAKRRSSPPNAEPSDTPPTEQVEEPADAAAIDEPAPTPKPVKAKKTAPAAKSDPVAQTVVSVVTNAVTATVKAVAKRIAPENSPPAPKVAKAAAKPVVAKAPVKATPLKAAAKPVPSKAPAKKAPPTKAAPKAAPAKASKPAPKKAAAAKKPAVKAKPAAKAKAVPARGKVAKAKPKAAAAKRPAAKPAAKKAAKPVARKPVPKKPAKKAPARPARPAAKKPAAKKPAAKKTTSKRPR